MCSTFRAAHGKVPIGPQYISSGDGETGEGAIEVRAIDGTTHGIRDEIKDHTAFIARLDRAIQ